MRTTRNGCAGEDHRPCDSQRSGPGEYLIPEHWKERVTSPDVPVMSSPFPGRPPGASSFFDRTPWGKITLVSMAAFFATAPVGSRLGSNARWIYWIVLTFVILTCLTMLGAGIIGGVVYDDNTREGPDPFRATLRRGSNPFGWGYTIFLVGLCPVAAGVAWVCGTTNDALFFLATMGTLTLLCALTGAIVRARQIGAEDGCLWFDTFTGRRTIAWRALDALVCDPDGRTLRLRTRDGRVTTLRAAVDKVKVESIAARLRTEARAASVTLADTLALPDSRGADACWAALEQGRRSLEQWRLAMAALARGDEGFRNVPVTREDLVRIVLDDRAPAERRIGAALGLTGSGDPEAGVLIAWALRGKCPRPVRVALARVRRGNLVQGAVVRAREVDRRMEA